MSKTERQAGVKFSYKKYYSFRNKITAKFPERFFADMQIENVANVLLHGSTQPAVVVSTDPLLIAAYADEMDAVMMLRFPEECAFVETYQLSVGSRLTTSCLYERVAAVDKDLFPGSGWSRRFTGFVPVVQLFIGKKDEKIQEKADLFSEDEWQKVATLAAAYRSAHPDLARDGFFYFKKR